MHAQGAAPIFHLPSEILEEIVDASPLLTQLSLCLVSNLLHSLTIRSLYREISLDSPASVVSCCRTLVGNPKAAGAVRSLIISYTQAEPNPSYFSAYYLLIRKSLRSLSELHVLRMLVHDASLISALDGCTFPRLWQFECHMTLTPSLISFLNRQPNLIYLRLSPHEDFNSPLACNPPPVSLPKLAYFIGNSEWLPPIAREATLRAAFVFWDAVDQEPQDAITALEKSSASTLNVLSCSRRGWNLDLLDLISAKLPDISVLRITNLLVVDSHPSEVTLNVMKGYVSRFTRLQRLEIHCVDVWRMGHVGCRMDHDFSTVTAWGAACPSLMECTLPHSDGMKWIRMCDNLWLPDSTDPKGIQWLWKMLSSPHSRSFEWKKVAEIVDAQIQEKGTHLGGFHTNLRSLMLRRRLARDDDDVSDSDSEESDDGLSDYGSVSSSGEIVSPSTSRGSSILDTPGGSVSVH